MAKNDLMDRVVNLCKRRGLVFPSSEIYGGFRSTWDYGPLGVLLKRNVKDAWWRSMVQLRDDVVGLDAAILMAPKVWEASGHLATFTDPLVDCRNCKERFRADQLPESGACPNCGSKDTFTEARQFNLMFKTYVGPVEDDAVGRLPAARDRAGHLRQLHQRPDDDAQEAAVRHRADRQVVPQRDHAGQLRLPDPRVRADGDGVLRAARGRRRTGSSTGATSATAGTPTSASPRTSCGCARTPPRSSRTTRRAPPTWSSPTRGAGASSRASPTAPTYDLTQHAKFSGQDLSYYDQEHDRRYVPYVIEPAAGADRATLAFLLAAYDEEEVPNGKGGTEKRTVLRLHPRLAPIKVAVLPLSKNEKLVPLADEVASALRAHFMIDVDVAGSIGRRYRRQDEVGTPLCVTIDFDTLDDKAVTDARPRHDDPGPRPDRRAAGRTPEATELMSDNYYEGSASDPGASRDEIRDAHRARVSELEAARAKKGVSDAQLQANRVETARVRSAWNVLSDPYQRGRYDAKLATPSAENGGVELVDEEGDGDGDEPTTQLTGWRKLMAPGDERRTPRRQRKAETPPPTGAARSRPSELRPGCGSPSPAAWRCCSTSRSSSCSTSASTCSCPASSRATTRTSRSRSTRSTRSTGAHGAAS